MFLTICEKYKKMLLDISLVTYLNAYVIITIKVDMLHLPLVYNELNTSHKYTNRIRTCCITYHLEMCKVAQRQPANDD